MQTVTSFIESMPLHAETLVVRAGEVRTKLGIVHRFNTMPDDLTVQQVLEQNGFGESVGYARLIAYGEDGKQVKSCSLSADIDPGGDTTARLVDGIIRSNQCIRRFMGTVTKTLEDRERTLNEVLARLIDAKEDALDEQAAVLQAAMDETERDGALDVKERALDIIGQLGAVWMQQQGGMTAEGLKAAVMSSPEVLDSLMEDPEVLSVIGERMAARSSDG